MLCNTNVGIGPRLSEGYTCRDRRGHLAVKTLGCGSLPRLEFCGKIHVAPRYVVHIRIWPPVFRDVPRMWWHRLDVCEGCLIVIHQSIGLLSYPRPFCFLMVPESPCNALLLSPR